ncbi:MAG: NAD-dependent epimerase/dehydratase family protein [Curtobacterium sp.]
MSDVVSPAPPTLVVGAGGFLGRAVTRATRATGAEVVAAAVPWSDPDAAVSALVDAVRSVRRVDGPWRILWCAGTGVVATGADVFAAEQDILARVLATTVDDPAAPGSLFFASSAGAVYAGCRNAPFSEDTEPAPLAPYGRAKLAVEQQFRDWATTTGTRLLVGRISNLYGPGANLGKAQGLVSQLALAHLEGRPSSIYVPMTTTRDYLYIDDAAAMVLDALDLVDTHAPGTATTKILASGQPATIAEVVATVQDAVGEPIDVRDGADPSATFQGLDLRFRSTVLPSVDDRAFLPFDTGVARTVASLRAEHRV